jgi:hypothetical protein
LVSELLARRTGRAADDLEVRTLAGAMLGAMLGAILTGIEDPRADYLALMDASLAYLEAGLPL